MLQLLQNSENSQKYSKMRILLGVARSSLTEQAASVLNQQVASVDATVSTSSHTAMYVPPSIRPPRTPVETRTDAPLAHPTTKTTIPCTLSGMEEEEAIGGYGGYTLR
uniref:Bifunctional NAD(P)H-hydrate repair enzyme Nnr n=1 Tax=Lygus hesperus TaxID=30085 RepID=A0A0A9XL69_LYGHE